MCILPKIPLRREIWLCIVFAIAVLGTYLLACATPALAASRAKAYPALDSRLRELYNSWTTEADRHVSSLKQQDDLDIIDNTVLVWIMQAPGASTDTIDLRTLERMGVQIAGRSTHFLEAWAPIDVLATLSEEVAGVTYVRPTVEWEPTVTSQGVSLIGASDFHIAGYRGRGVKAAIIDISFAGLSATKAAGELPASLTTVDFSGAGMESGDYHGTACAEIFYDVAPDATLYLIKIDPKRLSSLEDALNYCLAQGIQVVSASLSLTDVNFFDGRGDLCDLFTHLYDNGILPVIAAGNYAQNVSDAHHEGVITDADGDGFHEFAPGDEMMSFNAKSGTPVRLTLNWEGWPATNQDLDLYVYDSGYHLLAKWDATQSGSQPPLESGSFTPSSTGTYYVAIYRHNAGTGIKYELFAKFLNGGFEYPVASSSLTCPADTASALTVGAINYTYWGSGIIEPYSSRGPTNDGRLKPDICGTDGVSTSIYSPKMFYGTSAATPHVAGLATLIRQANPSWTVAQLRQEMISHAIDVGSFGPDNTYGYGKVYFPVPSDHTLTITAISATPSTVTSGGTTQLSAFASDSSGHSIASWSWSDGGAGGAFSSSAVQNPTYTAPENTSGSNRTITLSLTVKCAGSSPLQASTTMTLTVQPATPEHIVTVSASANPTTVSSGGVTLLSATVTDSYQHTSFIYQWSDNGAGGVFSSATVQNPSYTAPTNTSGSNRAVALSLTVTCNNVSTPVQTSTTIMLTVQPTVISHTVTVSASASPTTVTSGGTTTLSVVVTDSHNHTGFAYQWSDGGAGGAFSPSATVAKPTYKAPGNSTGSNIARVLTVTVTCKWYPAWVTATTSVIVTETTVSTTTHTVSVTANVTPTVVQTGGTAQLSTAVTDSLKHSGFAYAWSDNGAGGIFSPSPAAANPTYKAPGNTTGLPILRRLTVTVTCKWYPVWVSGSTTITLTENSTTSMVPYSAYLRSLIRQWRS